MPPAKSRYSLPSASQSVAPSARVTTKSVVATPRGTNRSRSARTPVESRTCSVSIAGKPTPLPSRPAGGEDRRDHRRCCMATAAQATDRRDAPRRAPVHGRRRGIRSLLRLHRREARPLPRARRPRTADLVRARRGRGDPRALRARVARAAGGERHPRGDEGEGGDLAAVPVARGSRRGPPRRSSLNYIAPIRRVRSWPASARSTRCSRRSAAGGGVPYADYGEDLHEAQAAFTRPLFENLLGSEWLRRSPRSTTRLLADPPARVADLACGRAARASRSPAPTRRSQVDGIDLDSASIEFARGNLEGSGVEDRV